MSLRKNKWFKAVIILLVLGLSLFLFQNQILKGIALWLIKEDPKTDHPVTLIVLGGDSYSRGTAGALLYEEGFVDSIVCTGGNMSGSLRSLGLYKTESEISKIRLVRLGVPGSIITTLKEGTSTQEEAELILGFCKQKNLKEIAILSTRFHTRRVSNTFKELFEDEGVKVNIWGCKNEYYDENNWWTNEIAMITLFNEYVKHGYYFLKY
ncbi:MAG: YdcF family protein [Bacteroidetes bacterium]|nr:YdcF family protein [Bacteroidota bacterium]